MTITLSVIKKVPNYKNIIDYFNSRFKKSEKIFYHVGSKDMKRGVCDFLRKLGVDYNVVLDYNWALKPQVVAAMMGMDVMRCLDKAVKNKRTFCFLTGDDYLIPIIDDLHIKYGLNIHVCYFPAVISRELWSLLQEYKIQSTSMSSRYFTYPKQK